MVLSDFVFVGEVEGDARQVVVRRGQRYFRLGRLVWDVIERLQTGVPRAIIESDLQDRYPVEPEPGSSHPIFAAALAFEAQALTDRPQRGVPRARLDVDVSVIAGLAAGPMGKAFARPWPALITLAAANAILQHFMPRPAFSSFYGITITPAIAFGTALSMFVIMALHELSHAAVAVHNGCRSHKIGLGIFFVLPVFYADVSEIWTLSPRRRVAVNLAGINCQLLIGALVAAFSFVAPSSWSAFLVVLTAANLGSVVLNAIPFAKFDGYWVLVDLTGINNLQKSGFEVLRSWLSSRKAADSLPGWRSSFAGVYAVLTTGFYLWIGCLFTLSLTKIAAALSNAAGGERRLAILSQHPMTWLFLAYVLIALSRLTVRSGKALGVFRALA